MLDFFLNAFRIPPFLLPIYIAAGERYRLPWQVLAAINEVESDYGYDLTVSSAGAEGWMQFLPAEWLAYGVDANGATVRDPYNPADAIFAAARYLAYAGAAHDLRGAIYAYNHSSSYVESVVLRAQLIAATPPAVTSGLTAIVDGRFPVGGGGAHPATPVWVSASRARSPKAGQASATTPAALAPPPSSAANANTPERTVEGVELAASPGAPVLAVQNAQVVRLGRDPTLGRFIQLRDAYGDTYTYARLGQVLPRVALARAGGQPAPRRGNGARPGRDELVPLRKGAWITPGTVLGSVPGVASPGASTGPGPGSPHFLFEIQPAGAGPIDPRPIMEAWHLLGETAGQPHPGTRPLFGPEAGGALIGEIQLMSRRQLEAHLLSDSRFHSYGCGRTDIAGGRIERPVLVTLYLLAASGLDPTVPALRCRHGAEAGTGSLAEHARGDAVAVTALDGVPLASHRGRSLAEPAVRLLLTLPPTVRPYRIIAAVRPREAGSSPVQPGPPGRIEIDFKPATSAGAAAGPGQHQQAPAHETEAPAQSSSSAAGASSSLAPGSQPEPVLSAGEWDKLIARISQLPEPGVPHAPTRAALADNATSPPPTAGSSPAPLPPPLTGTPSTATRVQKVAQPSHSLKPAGAVGQPARIGLAAPFAASGLASLATAPSTILLRAPQYPSATQPLRGLVELTAETSEPASAITFQWRPAEPSGEKWHEIQTVTPTQGTGLTSASVSFDTTRAPDGLYDIGVRVTPSDSQKPYESELPDRLIDNNETPIVELTVGKKGSEYLRGEVGLEARLAPGTSLPPGTELKPLVFEYAQAGSGHWAKIATVEWEPKKGVVKPCFETVEPTKSSGAPETPSEMGTSACPYLPPPEGHSSWDGHYDFRVVPEESAPPPQEDKFLSIPVRDRLIDDTPPSVSPPSVSPNSLGSHLHGMVTLEAQASDPEPGSGVEAVRFERSVKGSGAWKQIGEATVPPSTSSPYTHPLNTETLSNGEYELRATAVDRAGNSGTSEPIGVEVENEQTPSPITASIKGVVAPAHGITILGAVPASGGKESETWAYGFTSAPPAQGPDGSRLPYLAEGEQLVLLRYTDESGWQIADVPRCEPGSPPELCDSKTGAFKLLEAEEVDKERGGVRVAGSMAPSGEGWLWVAETSNTNLANRVGLFHRAPGGQFELDTGAMETLDGQATRNGTEKGSEATPGPSLLESLGSGGQLRLGESNGHVYGMLTAPQQSPRDVGGVNERLKYGLLEKGTWRLEDAPLPPESLVKLKPGEQITLDLGDMEAPGAGWGAFCVIANEPCAQAPGLILGRFQEGGHWSFPPKQTGLDALELTGALAGQQAFLEPTALKAEDGAVWIGAEVHLPQKEFPQKDKSGEGEVVARYDGSSEQVTNSWCTLPVANKCVEPLDEEHPAAVPDTILPDPGSGGGPPSGAPGSGRVALALKENSVRVFAHNVWRSIAAPGHGPIPVPDEQRGGGGAFTALNEGWLGGENALGHWSPEAEAGSGSLVSWPLPDRSPLTSLALPPGSQAGASESGALAVGLGGTTMRYDAATGWQIEPAPSLAQYVNLLGVAFAGPSSAFAVGQFGVIAHWNGSAWSEDPQSSSLTKQQLNAVAFAPSGEGWAVGDTGTILHYNGQSWNTEQPPPGYSLAEITSVTVAGSEVFAVARGNLIARSSDGTWHEVAKELLPSGPALFPGNLRLVAGLPDGGVIVAGRSVMLVREAPGESFQYAAQPLQGIAVALAPFRQPDGKLRGLVSIAPPVPAQDDVGGFPPGDGELMRQTDSGWQDLSSAEYAGGTVEGDGALKSDPVLALATDASGEHVWAAGGYAGTEDAAGRGTTEPLQGTSLAAWYTASMWRYDSTGPAQPPAQTSTASPNIPAKPGTVSFAFFSSPACRAQCTGAVDAQPDVNLRAAAGQIAEYAAQPGGPAFAMLGGNARGPEEGAAHPEDFAELPELLAPLGRLPLFAALGPKDSLAGREETRPWAEAFANAPAPFGPAPAAGGITPVSSGAPTPDGDVHRYYSFDTQQNGGTLRVIVLDNAKGSLEASAPGQMAWVREQLEEQVPTVVITALRLHSLPVLGSWDGTEKAFADDGEGLATLLAEKGVLAVFTTNPSRLNEHYMVPENASPGAPQIPEYEGASLGYQQSANNAVAWYFVSVNTGAREVHVSAVPVLSSLALKPVDGLSVPRSGTLRFQAVGRRAPGTLATRAKRPSEGFSDNFPGFDEYAEIPSPGCAKGRPCVHPSYSFTSSEPTIGDFVEATGEGSPFPKLNASGHPIPSSTSGLFCGYNSGSTTVTITAGLLTYSLPVTVQAGGFGPPCGTVFRAGVNEGGVIKIPYGGAINERPFGGAAAPPPPPPAAGSSPITPAISPPPPPPAPAPPPAAPHQAPPPPPSPPPPAPAPAPAPPRPPAAKPAPPPPEAPFTPLGESAGVAPALVPPATPPVEPIPPGAGGWAQSPSAAKKREESRKHASESAFTLRPAGASSAESSGVEWFYVAVGVATLLALLLSARGMRPRSGSRPALLLARSTDAHERERRRRTDERRRRRPGA